MRATTFLLALFLSLLLPSLPAQAQDQAAGQALAFGAGERILTFTSDVRILRDSSLEVKETIRIRAQGDQFRRGIFRDFPTRYQRDGRTIRVGFDVESVLRNGEPENWSTESLDNGTRLRIGSEDRLLTPGIHVYVIQYRTTRQIGFFEQHDELYWNVTGNGWAFPIDVAEARVRLPEAVPFGDRAFYTGPQGSTASEARVMEERPGEIWIRATTRLLPNEGLTIAVAWPKGVIEQPPPPSERELWLEENLPLAAALTAIAGLCFFYFLAWRRAGRGPRAGTVVPLFQPPDRLSAAATRYVRNMGYDSRVFASAIVDCGVSGALRLVEEEKGFWKGTRTWLKRLGAADDLPRPERDMHAALFMGGDDVEMDKKNHALFTAAQRQLREGLEEAHRGRTFLTNKGWAVAGLVALPAAMMLVGAAIIGTDLFAERGLALVPVLGIGLCLLAIGLGAHSRLAGPGRSLLNAVLSVILALAALFALITTIAIAADTDRIWPLFLPLVTLPLVISAFLWMAAPTREGRKLMDRIAGFEHYLSTTEEDRLERLHPPEKTPELFERYLPYAIALGVENRWAAKFESVLASASTKPGEDREMHWYSGSRNPWTNPGRFAAAMGGSLASAAAAASVAPGSSSGSGGGGSSGGGGGGGGGGGW